MFDVTKVDVDMDSEYNMVVHFKFSEFFFFRPTHLQDSMIV